MRVSPLELKELKPKRPKYRNTKVEYNGLKFDSILERDRWIFLEAMQKEGQISSLERQVRYDLIVNGTKVAYLMLDFRYHREGQGTVVEDAKGVVTRDWKQKAKLFEALYLKKINIVTKRTVTTL